MHPLAYPHSTDLTYSPTLHNKSAATSIAVARFFAALAHPSSDRSIPLHLAQRPADPPLDATVRQPTRDASAAQAPSSSSSAATRFWGALAYGASNRHAALGSRGGMPSPPAYSEKDV